VVPAADTVQIAASAQLMTAVMYNEQLAGESAAIAID